MRENSSSVFLWVFSILAEAQSVGSVLPLFTCPLLMLFRRVNGTEGVRKSNVFSLLFNLLPRRTSQFFNDSRRFLSCSSFFFALSALLWTISPFISFFVLQFSTSLSFTTSSFSDQFFRGLTVCLYSCFCESVIQNKSGFPCGWHFSICAHGKPAQMWKMCGIGFLQGCGVYLLLSVVLCFTGKLNTYKTRTSGRFNHKFLSDYEKKILSVFVYMKYFSDD